MHAVFHLKPGEPNETLFEYLRNLLQQQHVEITLRTVDTNGADSDDDSGYPNGAHYANDTEYLFSNPANKKFLEEQIAAHERGEPGITFTMEEFHAFSQKLMDEAERRAIS